MALTVIDKIEQTTVLKEGWNWLSFYVKTDAMTIASLLASIAEDVEIIKSQNAYLSFENGTWGGSLKGILSNGQMYAVKMKKERTLRIIGERLEVAGNPIELSKGWNWIGYYGRQVSTLADAFADLSPINGDMVKAQSGIAYYDTYEWVGSLPMLEPGQGYKFKNASDQTRSFRYPGSVVSLAPKRQAAGSRAASGAFQPVDYHNYSGNATMAVKVVKDNVPMANVEIGVFVDGECRAAAFTDNAGVAYLTIPGDDTAEMGFKVAQGAQITDIPGVITYETDGIYGSPENPIYVKLGVTTGIGAMESVAGTDSEYDLMGRKAADSQKGILIREGKKILRK